MCFRATAPHMCRNGTQQASKLLLGPRRAGFAAGMSEGPVLGLGTRDLIPRQKKNEKSRNSAHWSQGPRAVQTISMLKYLSSEDSSFGGAAMAEILGRTKN